MKYDAFISYSHAVDGKLAPAIQQALHKIAKPFFKLRALNIFRDETNLEITPELWTEIEKALNESQYLIYLASPKAADSKWVRKELKYWLTNKSINTLIIGKTAGEIIWNDPKADFDWTKTNALPHLFKEIFIFEPFIINLKDKEIQEAEYLSIKNPKFKKLTGKIAAKLHGKEYQELIGEDIAIYKKNKLIATILAILLITLATLTTFFGFSSNESKKSAVKSAILSKSNELNALALLNRPINPTKSLEYAKEAYKKNKESKSILGTLASIRYQEVFFYQNTLCATPFYKDILPPTQEVVSNFLAKKEILIIYNEGYLKTFDKSKILIDSIKTMEVIEEIKVINETSFLTYNHKGEVSQWIINNKKLSLKYTLPRKTNTLYTITGTENGEYIFIGTENGHLLVYKNGKYLFSKKLNDNGILDIAISPLGRHLITVSSNTIQILSINSLNFTKTATCKIKLEDGGRGFNPYFTRADFIGNSTIVAGLTNGKIQVYDLTGKRILYIEGHNNSISSIETSKESGYFLTSARDRSIKLWKITDYIVQGLIIDEVVSLLGHQEIPIEAFFSSNENNIISRSVDGNIKKWYLKQGVISNISCKSTMSISKFHLFSDSTFFAITTTGTTLMGIIENDHLNVRDTLNFRASSMHINLNNKCIIIPTSEGTLNIWDYKDNQVTLTHTKPTNFFINFSSIDSQKNTILTSSDHDIHLWNYNRKAISLTDSLTIRAKDELEFTQISKSGKIALIMIRNEQPRIYSIKNGSFSSFFNSPTISSNTNSANISTDDNYIIHTTQNGFVVLEKVNDKYQTKFTSSSNEDYYTTVRFSESSEKILATTSGGRIEIWTIEGEKFIDIKPLRQHCLKQLERLRSCRIDDADFLANEQSLWILSNEQISFWNFGENYLTK